MKLACTVTMVSLACEQALLFGRGSRERAIEGPLLVPIWSPWEPNLSHRRRGCQLGLLSINFVFRNVIFQPMVFPFVWAKYKWNFMRDRCKLSFPLPLAASLLARAFTRDSLRSPKYPNRRACSQAMVSQSARPLRKKLKKKNKQTNKKSAKCSNRMALKSLMWSNLTNGSYKPYMNLA